MRLFESPTSRRLSFSGRGKRWTVCFVVEFLIQNVYPSPKSELTEFVQRRR